MPGLPARYLPETERVTGDRLGPGPWWAEDDHDVADLVEPEVAVDGEQVAGLFLPTREAEAVAGGEPSCDRCGTAWDGDSEVGVGGLGEAGALPSGWPPGAEDVRWRSDDQDASDASHWRTSTAR